MEDKNQVELSNLANHGIFNGERFSSNARKHWKIVLGGIILFSFIALQDYLLYKVTNSKDHSTVISVEQNLVNYSKEMKEDLQQKTMEISNINQSVQNHFVLVDKMFKNQSRDVEEQKKLAADQNSKLRQQIEEQKHDLDAFVYKQNKRVDQLDDSVTNQLTQMKDKMAKTVDEERVQTVIQEAVLKLDNKIEKNKEKIDTKLKSSSSTSDGASLHSQWLVIIASLMFIYFFFT